METLSQGDIEAIRAYPQRQQTLGPDQHRLAIEAQVSGRTGPTKIGRLRKSASNG